MATVVATAAPRPNHHHLLHCIILIIIIITTTIIIIIIIIHSSQLNAVCEVRRQEGMGNGKLIGGVVYTAIEKCDREAVCIVAWAQSLCGGKEDRRQRTVSVYQCDLSLKRLSQQL